MRGEKLEAAEEMQFRIPSSLRITVLRGVGTQGAKRRMEGARGVGDDRARRTEAIN